MRLQDKVSLITGGAAGIGRATAETFTRLGAQVAVCDLNQEAGQALVTALGPQASFTALDVSDRAAVQAWVEAMLARYGRIDVLVNNAGITRDAQLVSLKDGELIKQMEERAFDQVVAVNLKGVFNCAQAVAPAMIRQGAGVILNISSVVALYGNFGQTNYAATKAAVIGMTKTWARELGRKGVRVNAVAPGFIATDMVRRMPEKVVADIQARIPLGRMGQPEDIANTLAWLASDEAAYIHGAVISVDGGIVLGT